MGQLRAEIDRVAQTTTFNGQKLLNGSFAGAVFQVGANAGDHLTIAGLADTRASELGNVKYGSFTSDPIETKYIGRYAQEIAAGTLHIQVGNQAFALGKISAAISGDARLGQVVEAINAATADTGVTAYLKADSASGSYQVKLRSASDEPVAFKGFTEATTGIGRGLDVSYQGQDKTDILRLRDLLIDAQTMTALTWGNGASPSTSGTFDLGLISEIRQRTDQIAGAGHVLADERQLFAWNGGAQYAEGKFWHWVSTVSKQMDNAAPLGNNQWSLATSRNPDADLQTMLAATHALHISFLNAVTNVQSTSLTHTPRMQAIEDALTALTNADASNFSSLVSDLRAEMGNLGLDNRFALTLDPAEDLSKAIGEAVSAARYVTESGFALTLADIEDHRGLDDLNISTQTGAWEAMRSIDSALDQVNAARGLLGALQTRFENVVQNIGVMHENLSAARGRIMDADYAAETATLSRA